MYPFVMRTHSYPVKTYKASRFIEVRDLPQLLKSYCLTLECIVNTDQDVYPKIIEGRTCFPTGRFKTYLSTPEIQHAISNDHIESIQMCVMYEKANIFKEYVDYFYGLRNKFRKSGNDVYAALSKLLLNSLYGKFGQAYKRWEPIDLDPTGTPHTRFYFDMDEGKRVYIMELNDKVYKADIKTESRDSFPAIAAHVTAYARLVLYNTLQFVGRENVYYGDTDSLLINDYGYQKISGLLDSTVLGCWSLDGAYDKIEIRGNKDYTMGDKVKIKGVRPNATIVRPNTYKQLQFGSLKGVIRSTDLTAPIIKYTTKHLRRQYKKGHVLRSGDVIPFELDDVTG